jgi:hypothetical protein
VKKNLFKDNQKKSIKNGKTGIMGKTGRIEK